MTYVDGFVLAVKKDKLDAYKKMAELGRTVWMEHGALSYVETVADDAPYGELTSFPRAVIATEDETVVFAWITYASREARDAVNAKVMSDPRMAHAPNENKDIFDGKRMIFGGFKAIVES